MKGAGLLLLICACGGEAAPPRAEVAARPAIAPPAPVESAAPSAPPARTSAPAEASAAPDDAADGGGVVGGVVGGDMEALGGGSDTGVEGAGGAWDPHRDPLRSPVHVTVRQGTTMVNGRLPPEVIQRIVRQRFAMFRACYEHGLRRDPTIAGRVAVKFVIGPNGDVVSASDDGSGIASPDVRACVIARASGRSSSRSPSAERSAWFIP